jgi:hypothetical protein
MEEEMGKAGQVHCSHISCEDVFPKTSHNSKVMKFKTSFFTGNMHREMENVLQNFSQKM